VVAAAQSNVATNLSGILLEARRLRDTGQLEAAYDITKKILSRAANPEAQILQGEIAAELEKIRVGVIGPLDRTPKLKVAMAEIGDMNLDHRAGYILSQIDGLSTFEDVIELSGMSRLETLGVFATLVEQDLIEAT
jgi:hypothetical protein